MDITPWLGDGYCDDTHNTETCGFDNGDCCDTRIEVNTGKVFLEAIIWRVHTHFFTNLSNYFLKLFELNLFVVFYHLSKSVSTSTTSKENKTVKTVWKCCVGLTVLENLEIL